MAKQKTKFKDDKKIVVYARVGRREQIVDTVVDNENTIKLKGGKAASTITFNKRK